MGFSPDSLKYVSSGFFPIFLWGLQTWFDFSLKSTIAVIWTVEKVLMISQKPRTGSKKTCWHYCPAYNDIITWRNETRHMWRHRWRRAGVNVKLFIQILTRRRNKGRKIVHVLLCFDKFNCDKNWTSLLILFFEDSLTQCNYRNRQTQLSEVASLPQK